MVFFMNADTLAQENIAELRFFQRLVEWNFTPRAVEVFDVMLNRPISLVKHEFSRQVYVRLIDHLLAMLKMPGADSAKEWEWRELYQLDLEIDPHYFSEGNLHRMLNRWPILEFQQKQVLVSVLSGYFHLRRGDFPAGYPSPVLSNQECEQWTRIFPPHWCWQSIDVLRRGGILAMASRRGYTAYARFTQGRFHPSFTPNSLRQWQATCWQAAALFEDESGDRIAAHRVNHLAASFAGRFNMLGLEGVCGDIPQCEICPLKDECRWYNDPANEHTGPSEIKALVRKGQVESMPTEQLFQGLFHMTPEDSEVLRERLAGTPLRDLAAKSGNELRSMFSGNLILPENLQILFELCKRFNEERMSVGKTFKTAWDVFSHFRMRLRDLKQEQFIAVLLNHRKQYLTDMVITKGTLDSSPVHPRDVFNAAIRESAASIIIVHNHPSGDPKPSDADIEITRTLRQVGELVGIPVLDHIVIADDRYTSLLEEGLIKP